MKQDLARIEQFLDALWLEKNLAENTLNAYRRDLSMMVEWLHHRGLTLATAQSDDLQALLAERLEGGYKATSSARLLSAVRRLFQYLYREKFREDDPSAHLASPKLPQRLPKDLSEAQVERLLQAPLIDQPLELRDKAMLEVLYATGLRVSELVGLTMSDISLRQGVVRVIGKGNKERLVPLGEEAVYWLETYLEHGRPWLLNGVSIDVLFPSQRAQQMTRQTFWHRIKHYAVLAGIDSEKLSPHVVATCAIIQSWFWLRVVEYSYWATATHHANLYACRYRASAATSSTASPAGVMSEKNGKIYEERFYVVYFVSGVFRFCSG